MIQSLHEDEKSCEGGCPLWFIHGTRFIQGEDYLVVSLCRKSPLQEDLEILILHGNTLAQFPGKLHGPP